MAKGQRQPKRTPEIEKKILDAMKMGASYRLACDYAGISVATLERWRDDNVDFADRLRASRGEGALSWLALIEKTAKAGDWRAAQWKLQVAYPDDYAERARLAVEHSGSVDVNVVAQVGMVLEQMFSDRPEVLEEFAERAAQIQALPAPSENKRSRRVS